MHLTPDALPGDAETNWQALKQAWPILRWVAAAFAGVTGAMGGAIWWLLKKFGDDLITRQEKLADRMDQLADRLNQQQLTMAASEAAIPLALAQQMPARQVEERLAEKLDRREFDGAMSGMREAHARIEAVQRTDGARVDELEKSVSKLEGILDR